MIGLRTMTENELRKTIGDFLARREKIYREVQDFNKADSVATDHAMKRMHAFNIEIKECERELELRKDA